MNKSRGQSISALIKSVNINQPSVGYSEGDESYFVVKVPH